MPTNVEIIIKADDGYTMNYNIKWQNERRNYI